MADIASMTGFSDATLTAEFGSITVEMKSVNGRFLEVSLRVPDEVRSAEAQIRERLAGALARGKVDCRVSISRDPATGAGRVNTEALSKLRELVRQVQEALPQAAPISAAEALRWPGVLDAPTASTDAWNAPLLSAVGRAIESLQKSRLREGAALRTALLERCAGIDAQLGRLREAVPRILSEMERRLAERMDQALGGLLAPAQIPREELNERIRQEVALHGLRADVAEEMDRLAAHVAEVRRCLDQGGAVGRRLDFLMQELNREANTIASKASAVEMTQVAVELKLLIEQMREQVQNLE
jgi:uncharacterized protein (TIGR00255 family)